MGFDTEGTLVYKVPVTEPAPVVEEDEEEVDSFSLFDE